MLVALRLAALSAMSATMPLAALARNPERVAVSGVGGEIRAPLVGWQSLVNQIPALAL
jgi:hypothetical protein